MNVLDIYSFLWRARLKCGEQLEVWTAEPLCAFQNFSTEIFLSF